MQSITKLVGATAVAATLALGTTPAFAWWGDDDYHDRYWGGGPWHGGPYGPYGGYGPYGYGGPYGWGGPHGWGGYGPWGRGYGQPNVIILDPASGQRPTEQPRLPQ